MSSRWCPPPLGSYGKWPNETRAFDLVGSGAEFYGCVVSLTSVRDIGADGLPDHRGSRLTPPDRTLSEPPTPYMRREEEPKTGRDENGEKGRNDGVFPGSLVPMASSLFRSFLGEWSSN